MGEKRPEGLDGGKRRNLLYTTLIIDDFAGCTLLSEPKHPSLMNREEKVRIKC